MTGLLRSKKYPDFLEQADCDCNAAIHKMWLTKFGTRRLYRYMQSLRQYQIFCVGKKSYFQELNAVTDRHY